MKNSDLPSAAYFEDLVATRYSCRAFQPRPVPREVVENILSLTQRTATWCNTQPWHVYMTGGASMERFREGLFKAASGDGQRGSDVQWPVYEGVHLERRREAGRRLYTALNIARNDIPARDAQILENFRLFGAPHMALVTCDEPLMPYGLLDCGGFVTNFLLAARAYGVDTVAQAAIAQYSTFIREFFQIPEYRRVVCGISFGFGDNEHAANSYRTEREPVKEAVTWAM